MASRLRPLAIPKFSLILSFGLNIRGPDVPFSDDPGVFLVFSQNNFEDRHEYGQLLFGQLMKPLQQLPIGLQQLMDIPDVGVFVAVVEFLDASQTPEHSVNESLPLTKTYFRPLQGHYKSLQLASVPQRGKLSDQKSMNSH